MLTPLVLASLLQLQPPASAWTDPCPATYVQQYARLIGAWQILSAGKRVGRLVIAPEAGGCLIHELEIMGTDTTGVTVGFFDRGSGLWQSSYIGRDGTVLRLAGAWRTPELLILEGPGYDGTKPGPPVPHRLTLRSLPDGRVHQLVEVSADSGRTWRVGYDVHWVRDIASASHD